MTLPPAASESTDEHGVGAALVALLDRADSTPASDLVVVIDEVGLLLGAAAARLLVADYSLSALRPLTTAPTQGSSSSIPVAGTVAGLAFARGQVIVADDRVLVPVTEGSERIGVLELTHPAWTEDLVPLLDPIVRVLVLILTSRRRYTDAVLRSRRIQALSLAAELQWDLLPPLSCRTARVSISGILEPAYSIGGDSFDFALNEDLAEFAIIDAVGHGMPAVLISTITVNGLRNARREGRNIEQAYRDTGAALSEEFEDVAFATGQIGSLDLANGELSWLNAGHPLPLLLRDGTHVRELRCAPSLPMGLGGSVEEIAVEHLQAGDRVLFYTDGAVESRSSGGSHYGLPRLSDFLVRAAHDGTSPVETLRTLSSSILEHSDLGLSDDSTLVLIEYHGP